MSYTIGKNVQYSFFGKADGSSVGVVIHGLPAGIYVNQNEIRNYIARLDPGKTNGFTVHPSKKGDFRILSGIKDDRTCAAPLCAVFLNDAEKMDEAQAFLNTALLKKEQPLLLASEINAAICFSGAVAKSILEKNGIVLGAHIAAIGNVQDKPFDPINVSADNLKDPGRYPFPTLSFGVGETMQAKIDLTAKKQKTVGGIIEIGVLGFPAGIGEPMFEGMENVLAKNLFAADGVCAVEFGAGFYGATLRGSEHNDAFFIKNNAISTATNHAGGVLGGITTGMPLMFKVTIEAPPFPDTIEEDYDTKDICTVPAAVPVVESVAAMTLLDLFTGEKPAQ